MQLLSQFTLQRLLPLLLMCHLQHPSSASAIQQNLSSNPSPLVLDVDTTLLVNLTVFPLPSNFSCSIEDSAVANVSSGLEFMLPPSISGETVSIELVGFKYGWTFLTCSGGNGSRIGRLQVTVLVPSGTLDIVYRVLLIVFVIGIIFCMGTSIELNIVLKLIKRPVALSIGWVCQFLIMPHLGLAVGQLIKLALPDFVNPNALAFGFLTYGCSPGGSNSNTWTYLLEGDLDLSVAMTFFSSVCAFFMMPLWLFAYGWLYIDPALVQIPFDQVAYTLLQSVVPVALGVLVRYKWPEAGKKITKAILPLAVMFIITVAGLGSYIYFYLLELLYKYPLVIPFAGMLPWSGFLIAYLFAIACRLSRPKALAVALECGVQNAGIPIQLLLFSIPKPDGDIASIVPVAATILTPVPLYFIVAVYRIRKRFCLGDEAGKLGSNEMELGGSGNGDGDTEYGEILSGSSGIGAGSNGETDNGEVLNASGGGDGVAESLPKAAKL